MVKSKKFEFLDIAPADAAFLAYGNSLEEVFANAALALFSTMTDADKIEQKEKIDVEASGYDLKSLLFDWLSELLFVFGSEQMLFSRFDVDIEKEEDGFKLKAVCSGEKVDQKRHEFEAEVKAVTYHQMEVKEEDGKWEARVVLDL